MASILSPSGKTGPFPEQMSKVASTGHLPGPGEIVMDTSSRIFQPVAIGDTVSVETARDPVMLRVVGLARMAGSGAENQGSITLTLGYMRARDLLQLTGPFPRVRLIK